MSERTITRLSAALLACAHCTVPEEVDDTSHRLHWVFLDPNQTPCAGTPEHVERFIERAFSFFDLAPPERFEVPVIVGGAAQGCAESGACYSPSAKAVYLTWLDSIATTRASAVLRHEVAHAVIDAVWGQSTPFFEEGLAEGFSETRGSTFQPVPVGDMLDAPPLLVDYTLAAYFVRFLIDTRGRDRFERMFRSAVGRSRAEIEALFAAVYGETFAAIEAEFLAGGPRCQFQLDVCDPERAVEVRPGLRMALPLSCEDPDVHGSRVGDELRVGTQRPLAIVDDGVYRVHLDTTAYSGASQTAHIRLIRCGACDEQVVHDLGLFRSAELELESGLYTFDVDLPYQAVVSLDLTYVRETP
jgi:hypothetical protein